MQPHTGSIPASPAGIALRRGGVTITQVAVAVDRSLPTVSRWLSGVIAPSVRRRSEVIAAVRALGGPDLAEDIDGLMPPARVDE